MSTTSAEEVDYQKVDVEGKSDVHVLKVKSFEGEDEADGKNMLEEAKDSGWFNYILAWPTIQIRTLLKNNATWMKYAFYGILAAAYLGFIIAGCVLNWDSTMALVIITLIVAAFYAWELLIVANWTRIEEGGCYKGFFGFVDRYYTWLKYIFIGIVACAFIGFVAWDVSDDAFKLIPLFGWVAQTLVVVFLSLFPHKINWRPVLWGYGLSFVFAIIVIRTSWGVSAISWLADQVTIFLDYSKEGAEFVFGYLVNDQTIGDTTLYGVWAFFVLPTIIFFGAVVNLLYYLGLMEYVISKIAWLMEVSMKTSGAESLVAASNIFIGQTEAPLLIKPFIKDLSRSELVAVMTCGFASIAGGVLAAFIAQGIPAGDLLTACVTSAPAALALAKVMHPEFEPNSDSLKGFAKEKTTYINVVEAFAAGASQAIPLVANIAAMLIAFLAVLGFLDAVVTWLGRMVNISELTITQLLGYLVYPFTFCTGVEFDDLMLSSELVATRLFANEFVAFSNLSELIKLRLDGAPRRNPDTNKIQWLCPRSESIMTYALCGFANLSSIGIVLGGIGGLCPERATDLAQLVVPSLIAGNFACMVRASIAGMLYTKESDNECDQIILPTSAPLPTTAPALPALLGNVGSFYV